MKGVEIDLLNRERLSDGEKKRGGLGLFCAGAENLQLASPFFLGWP